MKTVIFILKKNIFNLEIAILLNTLRQKGFRSKLLFEEIEGDRLVEKVVSLEPILIGFCTEIAYILDLLEGELHDTLQLLEKIKRELPDVTSFVGGIHATLFPELLELHKSLDVLFVGDMEQSLPQVAKLLAEKGDFYKVRGTIWRRGGTIRQNRPSPLTDLHDLPVPDFEAFLSSPGAFRKGYRLPFARGCPNKCSFCYNHQYRERSGINADACPRYYPAAYLLDCIRFLKNYDKDAFQTLYLVYGTFTHDKEFVREFCQGYRDMGIPFVIATRLDRIDDEIAALLKQANCSKVSVSIESGVEHLRLKVLQKNLSDADIYRGMAILKAHGLRVGCSLMFGFPGETLADAFATLDMARRIGADFLGPSLFAPLPNLKLTEEAVEQGLLPQNYGLHNFKKTVRTEREWRIFRNMCLLASTYRLFPVKPLIKFLVRMPPNRLFEWFFHLPRIRGVLKYDLGRGSVAKKLRYLLYAHIQILWHTKRPDLLLWGQKVRLTTDRSSRGSL